MRELEYTTRLCVRREREIEPRKTAGGMRGNRQRDFVVLDQDVRMVIHFSQPGPPHD